MRKPLSLILFCALFLCGLVPAFSSQRPTKPVSEPKVISAEFGLFDSSQNGKPRFVPTKVVPLVPEQAYGWIIRLRTDKTRIKWREEFTLPAKPETWGNPYSRDSREISDDGRVSILEREVAVEKGMILNAWKVAPGDPKGAYRIRVFVEESLIATFEFEVK